MKPETKIVLPALEVDVIGDVHTDPRNHPSRVARVSAETARANSVAQAQWIDHTTAPRGLLTSAHAYVAAALLAIGTLALAMVGQPSESQAAIDTTADLHAAVAQAQAQADRPDLWDEASRARAATAVELIARGGVR